MSVFLISAGAKHPRVSSRDTIRVWVCLAASVRPQTRRSAQHSARPKTSALGSQRFRFQLPTKLFRLSCRTVAHSRPIPRIVAIAADQLPKLVSATQRALGRCSRGRKLSSAAKSKDPGNAGIYGRSSSIVPGVRSPFASRYLVIRV